MFLRTRTNDNTLQTACNTAAVMLRIHSDIAFEVQAIKETPLVLTAPHSSLVHCSNSLGNN